jgi:hypothetical protein
MPPRQIWLFQFGCWAAIATAVMHVGFALAVPMTTPPGDGALHLLFAVCFSTVGAIGLAVTKRAQGDPLLMYAVARYAAIASVTLLALSLIYFSIVPGMFIAAVTTCFAVAAVKAPGI